MTSVPVFEGTVHLHPFKYMAFCVLMNCLGPSSETFMEIYFFPSFVVRLSSAPNETLIA